jgi:hypothetical protein
MSQEGPIESIAEPGIRATGEVLLTMRNEVAQLLNRHQRSFPGAQPVSFTRSHLEELKKEEYDSNFSLYSTHDNISGLVLLTNLQTVISFAKSQTASDTSFT